MVRRTILLCCALVLASCTKQAPTPPAPKQPGASQVPAPQTPAPFPQETLATASASFEFTNAVVQHGMMPGKIINRVTGIETEPPGVRITQGSLALDELGRNLLIKLTPESTDNESSVSIEATDSQGKTYTTALPAGVLTEVKPAEQVLGYYAALPFENKPWLDTETWHFRVLSGDKTLFEADLKVPPKDILVYQKRLDDPFIVLDDRTLRAEQTYSIVFSQQAEDVLVTYCYFEQTAEYLPFLVVQPADPSQPLQLRIRGAAPKVMYHFAHMRPASIREAEQNFAVFDYWGLQ